MIGAGLFRLLQASGQIDVVIGSLYVLLLGSIGGLMLKDALVALGYVKATAPRPRAAAPQPLGRLAAAALALLQRRASTSRRWRRWRSASSPAS